MSQGSRRSAPPPQRRRSSRPSLRSQLLALFGILVLAGGAFYTALVVTTQAYPIFFPGKHLDLGISAPGISSGESTDVSGRRQNFLVMGIDRRPHEGNAPTRTDTMFVMSVDPQTHSARALAMPRDLWIRIPLSNGGSTMGRINTAYALGETREKGEGIETVEKAVEDLLDIKIDHYVLIDFEGFREVIRLLDGVEVEVPEDLGVNDPTYSETERRGDFYPCVFEGGKTYRMDPSQALCYARVRNGSDDRERILRQQTVIDAVIKKAAQLNILSSPSTMLELWKRYKDTIETDVNDLQVPGFASLAVSIDRGAISYLSLGGVTTGWTTPDGAAVLLASEEGIKLLVNAFLSDNQLEQEKAVIEVQNGSDDDEQATKAVDLFLDFGIAKNNLITSPATGTTNETQIIDFTGKAYTAQRIAGWLGLPNTRIRVSTPEDVALRTNAAADIVVILGSDADLESAQSP
jgi:LCP family protein required for cell wall assembly